MNKYFLLFVCCLCLLSACSKDDNSPDPEEIVDINSFPLTLELVGFVNADINTYVFDEENGTYSEIPSNDLEFNNDAYFDDKSYFVDQIVFNTADNASLSLSNLPANDSFNQNLSDCDVTYVSDSIYFDITTNNSFFDDNLDVVMTGADRSELKHTFYQIKYKDVILDTLLESNATFMNYDVYIQPLLDDIDAGDTMSIQSYQLVYRP